jgi:nucleoside-diphosphate-sugar epimerase
VIGSALILGGTGQIGRAAARSLEQDGWLVTLAGRSDAKGLEHPFVRVDRTVPGELESAVGEGVDLLVDVIPFTIEDARQLVALKGRVGATIAISTASVYSDAQGRTLDEAQSDADFPRFPVPIHEHHERVAPGDSTYSTRKAAIENLLLRADMRATVLRPCAIHGPGARRAREWFFVKRILDGRRHVTLARHGQSRFHTTSTANLGELIRLVARRPGSRALNCGDPQPPTVLEIARAIAEAMEHQWNEILLPGSEQGTVGDHPWNVPRPLVLDMTDAMLLGYRPVTTYAQAVPETIAWLESIAGAVEDWNEALGGPAGVDLFDYAAEDDFVRALL